MPGARAPGQPGGIRRPAVIVLLVAASLGLLAALAALCFGGYLVVQDESAHGEEFDGLGTAIGLVLAAPAAVALVTLAGSLLLLRLRLTRASGVLAALVGVPGLLVFLPVMADESPYLPALAVAVTAVALLASGISLAVRPTA